MKPPMHICSTRKLVLEPHTQHHVPVKISAFDNHAVKLGIPERRKQMLSSTCDIVDTDPSPEFSALLSNCSTKETYLPKRMAGACVAKLSTAKMTSKSSLCQLSPMHTTIRVDRSAQSGTDSTKSSTNGVYGVEENEANNTVKVVHYSL